jgi:hypothetical protein
MHPDPKHLKNFARNTQWSRGNRVMNIRFLNRSHLPGLERLNARGLACHLIRAIGHHIVRLACRSVIIMARLTACWGDHTGITHTRITHIRITRAWATPSCSPDAGIGRSFNQQSRKPVAAGFVPRPLTVRPEAFCLDPVVWILASQSLSSFPFACIPRRRNLAPCDLSPNGPQISHGGKL